MTKKEQTKIYEDYSLKVRNFILSKVNDFALAEDLTSDVFLKVFSKIDSFDPKKASLSTWIFTIARHRLIDYYRTRKVNVELPEDLTYDIDESICDEDNLKALKKAIGNLNEKERDVIILHYYSKMTLKDIANKMGISYAYAKMIHSKALEKMKNEFKSSSLL